MTGIDFVETKPVQCQSAVWDPSDEVQRGTVLGWLFGLGIETAVHPAGPLIVGNAQVAMPGNHVVLDTEFGTVGVFTCEEYSRQFQNPTSAYDPEQPALPGFADVLAEYVQAFFAGR